MSQGKIFLLMTIGEHLQVCTMIMDFIVVDGLYTYNVIIGQPTLKALKAITSIYHLTM